MGKILLSVDNLSVSVDKYEILNNINLQINHGDFIFLKGSNGSGKTTFLNVLSCFNPDGKYVINGSISFNGEYNILDSKYSENYLKQKTYIEQVDPNLHILGMSVLEIISLSIGSISSYESLSRNDIFNDILSFFDKYKINEYFPDKNMEKILKSKAKHLSEGQKKIISLLSGLMRSQYTKILIADEPLNHLDSSNIKKTIDLFAKFRSDFSELAIIITTHCQAFPEPTKYWLLKDKQITISPVPYRHYDCFDDN
jgi:ABC-type multidrug transport system ATPase subunit